MTEPTAQQPTIELTIRPPGSIGEALDRRIQMDEDAEWYASAAPTPTAGAEGQAGGEKPKEKPSAVQTGIDATLNAQRQGGKAVADALMELATGTDVGGNAVHPLPTASRAFMGLMSILGGMSGVIGLGAGASQALENAAPDMAGAELLDSQAARALRMAMGGAVRKPTPDEYAAMTPEQQRAYKEEDAALGAPMTVKEALDTAIQLATPALAPKAVKGAKAAAPKVGEAMRSERGSIGAPPAPTGTAGMAPGPESRLRDIAEEVNRRASSRTLANRQVQTHAQTIEESRGAFPDFEAARNATREELAGNKAKFLSFSNYYRKLEKLTEELYSKAQAGDAEARAQLDDAMPLLLDMADRQIETGSTIGRNLEAIKIMADPTSISERQMRMASQRILDAVKVQQNGHATLRTELETTKNGAGLPKLERDLARREAEAARLEAEIEAAQQQAKDTAALTAQAADAAKEVAGLRATLAEAKKAGTGEAALARKVEQATAQADTLAADLQTATAQAEAVARMRQQLAEEQQAAGALRDEIKAARKRTPNVERLEAAILRAQDEIARLEQEYADVHEAWAYAQEMLEERGHTVKDIAELKRKLAAEGATGFDLMAMVRATPKVKRDGFLRKLVRGYKYANDVLHWAFLNNILSGSDTHVANIGGTGLLEGFHYAERYVAEWNNKLFLHNPEGPARGETAAMLHAAGSAFKDGVRLLGRTWYTGEEPLGSPSKIETRFDISSRYWGRDPNTPMGRLVDVAGMFPPTRWLMSADAFFKGYIHKTEIEALAVSEGLQSGLRGKELDQFVRFHADHPNGEMLRQAREAAMVRTLNAPPGPIGKAMMTIRDYVPAGGYLFPFLRTLGNSFKRAADISFPFSPNNIRERFGDSTPRQKAYAQARMELGTAIAGALVYQALQGNLSGALPVGSNKNQKRDYRAEGGQGFAARVGDSFVPYKRLDPLGQVVGNIVTGVEIYSQWGMNTREDGNGTELPFDFWDFALIASLAAGRVAMDGPWMQGLSNVFEAIERPDVRGKQIIKGLARGVVPNAMAQLTQRGVPGVVDPRPEVRDLQTAIDVIKSRFFAFADDVPPILHPVTGEPILRPAGWGPDVLPPLMVTTRKHDPFLEQVIIHRMNFSEPRRVLAGSGDPDRKTLDATQTPDAIPLKPWDYHRLKVLATREIKDRDGRTLHAAMVAMIGSDRYRQAPGGPDGGKEYLLQQIYRDFYQKAREQLMTEMPQFKGAVRARLEAKRERLRPQSSAAPLTGTLGR